MNFSHYLDINCQKSPGISGTYLEIFWSHIKSYFKNIYVAKIHSRKLDFWLSTILWRKEVIHTQKLLSHPWPSLYRIEANQSFPKSYCKYHLLTYLCQRIAEFWSKMGEKFDLSMGTSGLQPLELQKCVFERPHLCLKAAKEVPK